MLNRTIPILLTSIVLAGCGAPARHANQQVHAGENNVHAAAESMLADAERRGNAAGNPTENMTAPSGR